MPVKHCCGGYSEHNNCCPHDRCCNHPCGGCCCDDGCPFTPEPCCCKALKCCKENKKKIEELDGNLNALEGRVIRDEERHESDMQAINSALQQEIEDRITADSGLDNKIDKEIADRMADAIADAQYVNNAGDAYITFTNANGTEIRRINAKPFIKDGMLDRVQLVDDPDNPGDKALLFIFNTDSGKQDVYVPVGDLFEADDYYTKSEVYNKSQVDAKDTALNNAISAEATARQQADSTLDGKIAAEKTRAEGAEGTLQGNINAEALARQQADTTLDGKITTERTRAEGVEAGLQTAIDSKYTKPSNGIPKTDLDSSVQTSLGKADTALQSHQDISGKADKSNMTPGTYRSVTVNSQGIVTAGSNPTTLAGYGITDAKIQNGTITLGNNTITPITDISGKQDVIQDLSTIRQGAAKGATALQPGDAYDSATQSGNTITFTKNGGSAFSFTLPADAGSQTITVDGQQVTIQQAITNLVTEINNLKAQILWKIDDNDNTKIIAKNGKAAEAAGFFDTTVS